MAIQAHLQLREADGGFLEDTDFLTFACLPRKGEVIEYGRQYIVVRVIHAHDRNNAPFICLICNPFTEEEDGYQHDE